MTTTALHYGKLQRPESRAPPQVKADLADAVNAVYQQWLPVVPTNKRATDEQKENSYIEAERLFIPLQAQLAGIPEGTLENVIANLGLNHKLYLHNGQFITALFNVSGQHTLSGGFAHDYMGYRLARGKKLVLKNGPSISSARYSQGDIYNYGGALILGDETTSGNFVNFSAAAEIGVRAKTGKFVNFGTVTSMGNHAEGGAFFNFGEASEGAYEAQDGLFVMQNSIGGSTFGNKVKGGVFVHFNPEKLPGLQGEFAGFMLNLTPYSGRPYAGKPYSGARFESLLWPCNEGIAIDFNMAVGKKLPAVRMLYSGGIVLNYQKLLRIPEPTLQQAAFIDVCTELKAKVEGISSMFPDSKSNEEKLEAIMHHDWDADKAYFDTKKAEILAIARGAAP